MIKTYENDLTVLEAENNYMLSNGEVYGKKVYLSDEDDEENWYETEEVCNEY